MGLEAYLNDMKIIFGNLTFRTIIGKLTLFLYTRIGADCQIYRKSNLRLFLADCANV